jgi:phosphatidylglycerophosphate synthase
MKVGETMTFDEYLTRWSGLHGDAQVTSPIRVWLRATFVLAMPFRVLSPNIITLTGLLYAAVIVVVDARFGLGTGWLAVAILLMGVIDSLDGIVAAVTGRTTSFGSFLDSVVDRGVDVAIALLLYQHGAPIAAVLSAICFTLIHEYMRARALGLGLKDVGIITVAEKPTRIAIGVMFFLACSLLPQHGHVLVAIAVYVWSALALLACAQLFINIKNRLG